jgi:hypothetical protein
LGSDLPDPISIDDNDGSITVDGSVATTGAHLELTGSASANNTDLIASTDVREYRSFSLQLTGTFGATVRAQGSNDGTMWQYVPLQEVGGSNQPTWNVNASSATTAYHGAVTTKYLRVRTTSYSSGTVNAVLLLTSQPFTPLGITTVNLGQVATVSLYTGDGSPVTGAGADARTATNTPGFGPFVFNGTSWDRARSGTSANGTSGTGLTGAGILGWDSGSSVYRRVQTDSQGVVAVALNGGVNYTFSNISAVGNLLSERDLRNYNSVTAVVYNGNASLPYVQLQGSHDLGTWYPLPNVVAQQLDGNNTPLPVNSGSGAQVGASYATVMTAPINFPWVRLRLTSNPGGASLSGYVYAGYQPAPAVQYQPPQVAATSNVAGTTSSTTLLAANITRKGVVIYNDSTAVLYVKFGTTASNTSYTYYVAAGAHLELPTINYQGRIDGIWAAANGNARVTELY